MVPPHVLPRFDETMASLNLKSEVYIGNVQQWVYADYTVAKHASAY
jgi:hypothetical protein